MNSMNILRLRYVTSQNKNNDYYCDFVTTRRLEEEEEEVGGGGEVNTLPNTRHVLVSLFHEEGDVVR